MSDHRRAYVIFDPENDEDVRALLVGQSKNADSPFEVSDWSGRVPGDPRDRIRAADVAIVLCGETTAAHPGVNAEVRIAQEEQVPYFLLRGRFEVWQKPEAARETEKTYGWTWPHLKMLIKGQR